MEKNIWIILAGVVLLVMPLSACTTTKTITAQPTGNVITKYVTTVTIPDGTITITAPPITTAMVTTVTIPPTTVQQTSVVTTTLPPVTSTITQTTAIPTTVIVPITIYPNLYASTSASIYQSVGVNPDNSLNKTLGFVSYTVKITNTAPIAWGGVSIKFNFTTNIDPSNIGVEVNGNPITTTNTLFGSARQFSAIITGLTIAASPAPTYVGITINIAAYPTTAFMFDATATIL